ncbi:MAG: PD-(D/E)XK nuclease family transposase, partial [Faecalibacillus sp.]
MKIVFKDDKQCVQEVINIIIPYASKIKELYVEDSIKNLSGKDIRYDVIAVTQQMIIALEVQKDKYKASLQRTRLYDSLLTSKSMKPGISYKKQSKTAVIFIMEEDYYGLKKAVYHIQRKVEETGKSFQDGAMIMYVNGRYRGNDAIGRLMHDFNQKDYRKIHNKILREKVRKLKETKEGKEKMCKLFEEIENRGRLAGLKAGRKEGREAGRKEGREAGQREAQLKAIIQIMKEFDVDLEKAM